MQEPSRATRKLKVNLEEKADYFEMWLPELVPQSVLRDTFAIHLPSLMRRRRKETRARVFRGIDNSVAEWRRMLDEGVVKNRAELARRVGVSSARISKALGPMSTPASLRAASLPETV